MNRAVRWLRLGGRQRAFVLSLAFGCPVAVLVTRSGKPLLADSIQSVDDWRGRQQVVKHNRQLADRFPDPPSRRPRQTRGTQQTDASAREGRAEHVPPPQTHGHSVFDAEGDLFDDPLQAWHHATDRVAAVCGTFTGIDLSSIREKITGLLIPQWIRRLPGWLNKLQNELSMKPWSLSWEIWEEAHDPEINPEILWDAKVRISTDLCDGERHFLAKRRLATAKALARYLGVPEKEVHPEDVPVIGLCGSGGGLRALVAGASSFACTHEDGLFDCVTYLAGVSGSCWLQALYYSSIGQRSHKLILEHLKNRIGVHIAYPPTLLSSLSQSPTNKYLLSGVVEKLRGVEDADFGLVDIYGLALAARLMVPNHELRISNDDLKISKQRKYIDDGSEPLPIYTAVRHEIPDADGKASETAKEARFTHKHYDWFQWFEWTPYEFFCEELNAGIPTWAVGRKWNGGSCEWRENGFALPELRIPLMMGIWGSAFCATLSHYYKEIRPVIQAAGLSQLDTMLAGKNDDWAKVHPLDPAVIPNFALGLRGQLPASCPESIHKSSHLALADAGMANNLPIYPLLRPGRDVDLIIAFDASADVKADNWIKVVDGYARQRNIQGWPMGAGWPPQTNSDEATVKQLDEAEKAALANDSEDDDSLSAAYFRPSEKDLGYCTVWVGSTSERLEFMDEPNPNRIDTEDEEHHLRAPDAGIAVVYFPFLANDKVPGVDPMTDDFMSTWNFVYTPEEIDKVVALARANYQEGTEQTKRTIRAVWERKRETRLRREREEKEFLYRTRVRRGTAHMKRNWDHGQGDQFGGI